VDDQSVGERPIRRLSSSRRPAKLATNPVLRAKVEQDLKKKYSPEQITGRLRREFPDGPEMRVSPETIYQSICVQSRGALQRDLAVCLRTGRAVRRPSRKVGQRKNHPEHDQYRGASTRGRDRAVPGHGRRPDLRHVLQRDRHLGLPQDPLRDARSAARPQHRRRRR
jgi:IS30 family transposase